MIETLHGTQIVLAAFGTSSGSSRIYRLLGRRFEERFEQAIPMGFTSRVGEPKIRTVLEDICSKKEKELVIAPLFMIAGRVVMEDICRVVEEYRSRFKSIRVAAPLLPDRRLFEAVKEALLPDLERGKPGETGILLVGHGTPEEDPSRIYMDCARKMQSLFPHSTRVAFGNVEFSAPYIRDVLGELIMSDITRLVIQPFMIVDGVHIHEDIKGALDGEHHDNALYRHLLAVHGEPFKQRLGEMEFVYKPGLGAYRGVFELFADHTLEAIAGNGIRWQGRTTFSTCGPKRRA